MSPTVEKPYIGGRAVVCQALKLKGIPDTSVDIFLASITTATFKQYNSSWKKWWQYCCEGNHDMFNPSMSVIIKFLTNKFEEGASYGSLSSLRAAISLITTTDISNDSRLCRFFKGVYNLRPNKPKYNVTWDPTAVLDYLATWYPNESITIEQLTLKITSLMALTTGHRAQTLSLIDISNVVQRSDGYEIKITERIKTSGVNRQQPLLVLPFFEEKPHICVAKTLRCYLTRTSGRREVNSERLLITFKKPYHAASSQTISRWIKAVLKKSGVDTTQFSAHSTRHASTSAAYRKGVSLDQVRITAGWTSKSGAFAKFYNRPVVSERGTFARAILDG